jgi:hypothetical protein
VAIVSQELEHTHTRQSCSVSSFINFLTGYLTRTQSSICKNLVQCGCSGYVTLEYQDSQTGFPDNHMCYSQIFHFLSRGKIQDVQPTHEES